MKVTLGGWCGTESGRHDDAGVQWVVSTLEGWWDSPGARTDFAERPQGHGSFDAPTWAEARVITVEGRIGVDRPENLPALQAARRRTQGLLVGEPNTGTLTVEENGQRLQCGVRRSDKTTCDPVGAFAYDFSVQLTAPDPVRYEAVERQASTGIFYDPPGGLEFPLEFPLEFRVDGGNDGRLDLSNPGTAATWPVFRIDGPTGGLAQEAPVLVAPNGDRLSYEDPLRPGDFLVIDTQARRVLLQGTASRRTRMRTAQFAGFEIPAGAQSSVLFSCEDYPNVTSSASATWRAGFW